MKEVTGSTSEEQRMIKAIQRKLGALDNGVVGNQTMSDIAIAVKANCFPLNVELYGQPCLISQDISPLNPSSGLPANSISGSFSYQSKPCSVLIDGGKIVYGTACHWFTLKRPESVMYKTSDGKVRIARVTHLDAPVIGGKKVDWAVGGMGLLDFYDPAAEGFTGAYSDVLRRTNHTVLGYRNGMFYGVYCKNMTASQANTMMRDKFKMELAVLLDGGHVAAINGGSNKINVNQRQYYAVRFV